MASIRPRVDERTAAEVAWAYPGPSRAGGVRRAVRLAGRAGRPGAGPGRLVTGADERWGPLRSLAGEWEGDAGVDLAHSHARGAVVSTPYRERTTFTPFGPVVNGRQQLFGLDYRSEMWRLADGASFHAEVGYWLWDAATGEVLRAFVVPRGVAVLAGGTAAADAAELSLAADLGASGYAIAEGSYLAERASSRRYRATITTTPDGTWRYREETTLHLGAAGPAVTHVDENTLRRPR